MRLALLRTGTCTLALELLYFHIRRVLGNKKIGSGAGLLFDHRNTLSPNKVLLECAVFVSLDLRSRPQVIS